MLNKLVKLFFAVVGTALGYSLMPDLFAFFGMGLFPASSRWFDAALFCAVSLLLSLWMSKYVTSFIVWTESTLKSTPFPNIVGGSLGLIAGLLVAYMLGTEIRLIPLIGIQVQFFISIVLGYLGCRIGFVKRDDLFRLFSGKWTTRNAHLRNATDVSTMKLLDTSAIIDGRIADLVQTGFVDGTMGVPAFVLHELQHLADSENALVRNRGRRGLDILNEMKQQDNVRVQVLEADFDDIKEVDSKLVRLAKQMNAKILTNDFNLNKVCQVQNVPVLNVHDLVNALKPILLPGEEMDISVVKEGKESHQGIGYLEDGTMVVIEEGRDSIGRKVAVTVTSVLQTSAGRMIFAKPKIEAKAI